MDTSSSNWKTVFEEADINEKCKLCLTQVRIFDDLMKPFNEYCTDKNLYDVIGGQTHEWHRVRNNLAEYARNINPNVTLMWQALLPLVRACNLLMYVINPGVRAMLRYEGRLQEV